MIGNNSKRGRKCDEEVDRISPLPDDFIVYILSFLSLKEAAATSLVSPRWSQLWKYTPNLIFEGHPSVAHVREIFPTIVNIDSCPYTQAKNIEWVNLVTSSHKAGSLKQFTLDFTLRDFQFLAKWLHFALSRRVEIFKLNFHRSSCVLDINMLATIQSSDYRFLRELTLEHFFTSGEVIERFLQNSPLLERLVLNIHLNSNLVIVGRTLNYLELGVLGAFSMVKVWAPKLTFIRCASYTSKLLLEDMPNLVDASIELDTEDTMDCLANATPNLEALTILLDIPQALSVPNKMSRLKKLFLNYLHVNKEFLLPVTDLLDASPCLQEFRLKVTDQGHYTRFTGTEFIFKVPEPGKFQHCRLKFFEFTGFYIVAPDHMELLRCIVKNCVALEETIINPSLVEDYSMVRHKLSIDYPESNKYKILPVSYDDDRDWFLRIKKFTGRKLAAVVPRHVDLLIGHSLPRPK